MAAIVKKYIFPIFSLFCAFISVTNGLYDEKEFQTSVVHTDLHDGDITYAQLSDELDQDVDARCALCKFFEGKIVSLLESPSAKAAISNAVDQACRAVVNTTLCDFIGTTVMNYVENLINNDLQPEVACVAAKFCPAEFIMNHLEAMMITREIKSSFGCKMCQYFVQHLDELVDKLVSGLESLIYPYCDRLPAPTDKECMESVDTMFKYLKEKYLSQYHLCSQVLHICSS